MEHYGHGVGGNGTTRTKYYNNSSSPVQIPGTTWSSISTGNENSFAIKTDGTLWSWGPGQDGQLGQNSTTYRSSPVQIPGTTWSSVSSGRTHSLATKTDNTLWAWGRNCRWTTRTK
jgi:alpha-tubulin suppressor-like RCC1 family protein